MFNRIFVVEKGKQHHSHNPPHWAVCTLSVAVLSEPILRCQLCSNCSYRLHSVMKMMN